MGYCVEYNPEFKNRYPSVPRNRKRLPIGILIWGAAAVTAVYILVSSGVLRHLIPGDPNVTTAAFSLLVEEIAEGESVRDAFFAFCREIVVNAT